MLGGHRQEDLRGADVAGGLLAPDVLLAGLQGEAVGRPAIGVDGDADQAPRQLALEARANRRKGRVRAPEAQRHTEALGRAHHDVGADLPRWPQDAQRQQIRRDDRERPGGVEIGDERLVIADLAQIARVRQQRPEAGGGLGGPAVRQVEHLDVDPERLGAGLEDGDGLGKGVGVDDEHRRVRARGPPHQRHRLGRGGALVQQRGARGGQAGEVLNHGLEVQQRLQPALADLGLVRRVGGVPGRVLQHVAHDHRGRDGAVVAHPDHRHAGGVACGQGPQLTQHLGLAASRVKRQRVTPLDGRGDGRGGEVAKAGEPQGGQHAGLRRGIGTDVPPGEGQRGEI